MKLLTSCYYLLATPIVGAQATSMGLQIDGPKIFSFPSSN